MKTKRYWLRGGLIGIGVSVLMTVGLLLMMFSFKPTLIPPQFYAPFALIISFTIGLPVIILDAGFGSSLSGLLGSPCSSSLGSCSSERQIAVCLIVSVMYIILGVIIGWIYGKKLDRKKTPQI